MSFRSLILQAQGFPQLICIGKPFFLGPVHVPAYDMAGAALRVHVLELAGEGANILLADVTAIRQSARQETEAIQADVFKLFLPLSHHTLDGACTV